MWDSDPDINSDINLTYKRDSLYKANSDIYIYSIIYNVFNVQHETHIKGIGHSHRIDYQTDISAEWTQDVDIMMLNAGPSLSASVFSRGYLFWLAAPSDVPLWQLLDHPALKILHQYNSILPLPLYIIVEATFLRCWINVATASCIRWVRVTVVWHIGTVRLWCRSPFKLLLLTILCLKRYQKAFPRWVVFIYL